MIWSFKTENPFEVNIGEGFRTAERSKLKSHNLERKKKALGSWTMRVVVLEQKKGKKIACICTVLCCSFIWNF